MDNYIIHSGGAIGTDNAIAEIGFSLGMRVVNHSFNGHSSSNKGENIIHSHEELIKADHYLFEASKILKKIFPSKNNYTNNLLRRNYLIIKDVPVVYAIGELQNEYVAEGGTGWTLAMAKILDKLVFLYSQKEKKWYTSQGKENFWPLACNLPNLVPVFAGIGTRKLTKVGSKIISNLLSQTNEK